ncbi:addiction module antidote protein [Desulfovibrio sp. JC010]|uniref:addiction module antidote protein n=1 Tax=Desulfovibrio sp. JC010 TaxID=2593641 RepID=UPI0013D50665|nr:addiction module antidote protein [Desulfovibrio sp. JC010]NDV27275.1 putative addiction module antidote protein [Desulfovibrio sp. JC010]
MVKTKPFDTSEYLDSEEMISEYLSVAAATGDPDDLLIALSNVAKARGMTQLAKDSGLGRESLYKALSPGSQPRYSTILKVLGALGVSLRVEPKDRAV